MGLAADPSCTPGFDCASYLSMALDPTSAPHLPPQHAARILPALAVHALTWLGVPALSAFRWLAIAAFVVIGWMAYGDLRRVGSTPGVAATGTMWLWLVPWPFAYCLFDVAHAGYLWTFPAVMAMARLTASGRTTPVALIGAAASLCRQELLIATVLALAQIFWKRKDRKAVVLLVVVVLFFFGVQRFVAPTSGQVWQLIFQELTVANIAYSWLGWEFSGLAWAILPTLVLLRRPMASSLVEVPWLVAYVLAVFGLETLTAGLAGPGNFGRTALLALWPVWWLLARELVRPRRPWWICAASAVPIGYVVMRDGYTAVGPSWHVYRSVSVPVFGLIAPVLFAIVWWASLPNASARRSAGPVEPA